MVVLHAGLRAVTNIAELMCVGSDTRKQTRQQVERQEAKLNTTFD